MNLFQKHPNDKSLYLDLMKKSLLNLIYEEPGKLVKSNRTQTMIPVEEARKTGLDWPKSALTMIGMDRLDNIQFCCEDVIKKKIPGDFIETGVWRGGATIFMRSILKAYGVTNRKVWVADSFRGLPPPNNELYLEDKNFDLSEVEELSIPKEVVAGNFQRYGLLDDQVVFLEGWFKDTLKTAPIDELAVLRLDGDLYESTMDALTALYPKLSPGGYIIIDDFGAIKPARQAVLDYRQQHGITEGIIPIDFTAVYWQKGVAQTNESKVDLKVHTILNNYEKKYQQSLKSWAIYHQKEIVLRNSFWMGVQCIKNPLDNWVYQELIFEQKPDLIIEIGSKYGGSTLYFAHLLDNLGKGKIISIDIDHSIFQPIHKRIIKITGESGSHIVFEKVKKLCRGKKVLIIHDGDHHQEAVLKDLQLYRELIPVGGYFIVEDGIVDMFDDFEPTFMGKGPMWAIQQFLLENDDFIPDISLERYILTQSPQGFLKRIR